MGKTGWVDGRTQFYNGVEWKFVEDYIEGEEILVYDPDTKSTMLEVPVEYNQADCEHFCKFWGKNFCECLSNDSDIDEIREESQSKCENLTSLFELEAYQVWYNSNIGTENEWLLAAKRTFNDGKLDGEVVFEPYNPKNCREITIENGKKYSFITSTGYFISQRAGKICISLGEKYAE